MPTDPTHPSAARIRELAAQYHPAVNHGLSTYLVEHAEALALALEGSAGVDATHAQVDLRELRACAVILNAEAHADASAVVRAAADHIERLELGDKGAAEVQRMLRSEMQALRADLAAAQSHARDYDALVDTLAAERKLRVEAEAALASAWEAEKAAVWQVQNATAHLQRLIPADPNMSLNLGMLCCQVEHSLAAVRDELASFKMGYESSQEALTETLAGSVELAEDITAAQGYASRLFLALAPQCELQPDLLGVLTQLDNWCAGARADLAAVREELAVARALANRTGIALTGAQTALAHERERTRGLEKRLHEFWCDLANEMVEEWHASVALRPEHNVYRAGMDQALRMLEMRFLERHESYHRSLGEPAKERQSLIPPLASRAQQGE